MPPPRITRSKSSSTEPSVGGASLSAERYREVEVADGAVAIGGEVREMQGWITQAVEPGFWPQPQPAGVAPAGGERHRERGGSAKVRPGHGHALLAHLDGLRPL